MRQVDPYPVVRRLLAETATSREIAAVSERQMREAVACVSAGIAALGLEPAVDGEVTHPQVLRGRWLLELLRHYVLPRAVAKAGGGPS